MLIDKLTKGQVGKSRTVWKKTSNGVAYSMKGGKVSHVCAWCKWNGKKCVGKFHPELEKAHNELITKFGKPENGNFSHGSCPPCSTKI